MATDVVVGDTSAIEAVAEPAAGAALVSTAAAGLVVGVASETGGVLVSVAAAGAGAAGVGSV